MRDQSPVLRFDLHERLPLDPLKGRVKEILELELVPEVDTDVNETQVSLSGHMIIKGTCLAETSPLIEYEWEQESTSEEVRAERTSEPFPFEFQIPMDIVLPRHRVSDPGQLRVSISQMDFDLSSPHELEVLAELVVEGVRSDDRRDVRGEQWPDRDVEVSPDTSDVVRDMASSWSVQLVSGRGSEEAGDMEEPAPPAERVLPDDEPSIDDDSSKPDVDEFEVVARAEPEKPMLQTDVNESASSPWEDTESALPAERVLEDTASRDETADDELPLAEPYDEEPVVAGESVRVTIGPHAQEEPGDEVPTTWSQWFSAAEKPPVEPLAVERETGEGVSDEKSDEALDVAPTDSEPSDEVHDSDRPSEQSSAMPTMAEEGASETSTAPAVPDDDGAAAETREMPTLSDYLAPILKGKAERFVSLRLYRVSETEHLEDVARQFDVSVSELMRLNRIAEPTFLDVGNVLFIPVKKE